MKYYWHIHHEVLLEPSDDIGERIEYIKNNKPVEEIPIRLHLLKEVKGRLPEDYDEAWKAYDEAYRACKLEIEALHELECPNCPWDGKTIFPNN